VATHLRITGIVQGVGYRYGFGKQARALGLSGWVRNRADGSVEAIVDGAPDAVQKIMTWAWRGPSAAQVSEVMATEVDAQLKERIFEQLPTV
jgi:acylphosphatase